MSKYSQLMANIHSELEAISSSVLKQENCVEYTITPKGHTEWFYVVKVYDGLGGFKSRRVFADGGALSQVWSDVPGGYWRANLDYIIEVVTE